jgi:DNA topoisomerase-1
MDAAPVHRGGLIKRTTMDATLALSHQQLLQADRDPAAAAQVAHLLYVADSLPGITRRKKGKGFAYLSGGKEIKDAAVLRRIQSLVIPPAWTNVWICADPNGHIQATGLDLRCRKQYRYHPQWIALRNETKFHRLYEFGKALPALRERIATDFHGRELTREKVLATVLSLMERTYIRVGNNEYEKANGSYGLTTLKNKHVTINGDTLLFSFIGKKGVHQDITLHDKRLARAVSQCRDIPGHELFQYYDHEGGRHPIDSGMVNQYIHEAMGTDFTAKDLRTWAGSLHALQAFRCIGESSCVTECKKNIVAMLDAVSKKLGNTRAVCKKYYVHPGLIRLYEENKLVKYIDELDATESASGERYARSAAEEVLMKILKQYIRTAPINR